jgi:flagellar basal-body rod protein FlgG
LKNIWVPLSGQIAQQRKVETIANNIANANTPGFKKDRLAFKEHLTALDKPPTDLDMPTGEWSPDDFYRTQGAENAYVKVDGSYTDFQQGPLNPTNNALDMALHGKGFFEVLTPNGVRFTRAGNFSLSRQGELVTNRGFKLLSPLTKNELKPDAPNESDINQRIIKIPMGSKISVSREGDIFNASGKIGNISVVEFNDMAALRKEGHSLFINNAKDNLKRDKITTSVNQGFMEGSNVNSVKEMSELINAHRHFDNIQKAINTYDSISSKIVNDIAKF